jgi:cell division protein FtsZ
VHTLVRVQNDLLLEVAPKDLRLEVAFCVADEVLRQGIQGITELVTQAGLINLDFASVAAVIRQGGNALMAIGRGDTVQQAAEAALGHPLLENALIDRASALLVHVTGDSEMGLADIDEAMSKIIQRAHPAVDLLFGASEDQEIGGRAQVILIATGIRESRREPIAVQSLFGVPLPATEKDDIPEEPEPADVWESLDVPAFMRRPELSGLGTHTRE